MGGGKKGVSVAFNHEDMIGAMSYSFGNTKTKKVLAEEYVEGDEYSVEYISFKGQHHFVAITRKTSSGIPFFVELIYHQPSGLDDRMTTLIKETVEKSLTLMGITNSVSHTEIKIDNKGRITIIEIGPRMGGGNITSDLVKISTGYDFVNNNCLMVCGEFIEPKNLLRRDATVIHYTPYTKEIFEETLSHRENKIISKYVKEFRPECKNNIERSGYIIFTD